MIIDCEPPSDDVSMLLQRVREGGFVPFRSVRPGPMRTARRLGFIRRAGDVVELTALGRAAAAWWRAWR